MRQLLFILILLLSSSIGLNAQVELLKQKQVNASFSNPSLSIDAPVGNERLLVVLISNEYLSSSNYDVKSVEYGGVPLAKAGDFAATSLLGRNEIEVFYLTDSLFYGAADSSIVVTYNILSLNGITEANYTALFFGNVEQTNPIFGFTGGTATNANTICAANAIVAGSNDGILSLVNSSETNVVFAPNSGFTPIINQNDISTSKTIAWRDVTLAGGVNPSATSNKFATRVAFTAFAINNSNGVALPIKLIDLKGNRTEKGVELKWSTLSEANNDYFLIERSTDFEHWVEVDVQAGAGNSRVRRNYHFEDVDAENLGLYYRLTQFDYNGNSVSFDPIYIAESNSNDEELAVYPNPSSTVMRVVGGNEALKIFDLSGQEMPFNYNYGSIDVSQMSNGIYFLVSGDKSLKFLVEH